MALQLGALRDALLDAGAKQEKADKAAEELAGYESRLASIDTRPSLLSWMVGASITLSLILIGSMFALWTKLGEISGQLATIIRSIH